MLRGTPEQQIRILKEQWSSPRYKGKYSPPPRLAVDFKTFQKLLGVVYEH